MGGTPGVESTPRDLLSGSPSDGHGDTASEALRRLKEKLQQRLEASLAKLDSPSYATPGPVPQPHRPCAPGMSSEQVSVAAQELRMYHSQHERLALHHRVRQGHRYLCAMFLTMSSLRLQSVRQSACLTGVLPAAETTPEASILGLVLKRRAC